MEVSNKQTAAFPQLKLIHQPLSRQSLALKKGETYIDWEMEKKRAIVVQWSGSIYLTSFDYYSTFRINDWVQSVHTSPSNCGPIEVMKYLKVQHCTFPKFSESIHVFKKIHTDQMSRSRLRELDTPGLPNTNTEQNGQDDNKLKTENK